VEKSRVTLTGTPAKIVASIAFKPAAVPGILMKKFGRAARAWSRAASAAVVAASSARRGETSSETKPSTPSVRSYVGRKRSAARRKSSRARSKKISSVFAPPADSRRICSS
jgi:hypothetical protein